MKYTHHLTNPAAQLSLPNAASTNTGMNAAASVRLDMLGSTEYATPAQNIHNMMPPLTPVFVTQDTISQMRECYKSLIKTQSPAAPSLATPIIPIPTKPPTMECLRTSPSLSSVATTTRVESTQMESTSTIFITRPLQVEYDTYSDLDASLLLILNY